MMKLDLPRLILIDPLGARKTRFEDINATKEIIPPWYKGRKGYIGYHSLFHALTVCSKQTCICVVVQLGMGIRAGLAHPPVYLASYRVFKTNFKKHKYEESTERVSFEPYLLPIGIANLRLTHVYKRRNRDSWSKRIKSNNPPSSPEDVKQFMMDFMDLRADEIHTVSDTKFKKVIQTPTHTAREITTFFSDTRVNYNQYEADDKVAGGTYSVNFGRACRREKFPGDPNFTDDPRVYITITQNGIKSTSSDISFMATLAHEATHARYSYRMLFIIDQWIKSGTKKSFFAWIVPLGAKKKAGITRSDIISMLELCHLPKLEFTGQKPTGRNPAEHKAYGDLLEEYATQNEIDFSDEEIKTLLRPIIKLKIGLASTMHFFPYLEGFSLKIWLLDVSEIVSNSRAYSGDIRMMQKFYKATSHISGMRDIALYVVQSIVKMLDSVSKRKKTAVLDYVLTKNHPNSFYEILVDNLS